MMKKNEITESDVFAKRIRRHVSGRARDYFAIVPPGFEACCRKELIDLGIDDNSMTADLGGIAFAGRFVDCHRANLHVRTATRILMRIDSFVASNPRRLNRQCAAIPWELFLPAGTLPDIHASSRRSRLYHTDLIAGIVRDGLIARLGLSSDSKGLNFSQALFVRLADDRVTLSLDSSGDPLYKRGLKASPARAPLRETLAAAILLAAGYDGRRPLVDPMCGSGSFSLEAAMMAKGMAPGIMRRFAFMDWPAFRERQWAFLKREAEAETTVLNQPPIHASDLDAEACRALSGAISDNGLSDAVTVAAKDFFDCEAGHYDDGPGLVAINPPYGIRIGSVRQAAELFQRICRHLEEAFRGWDVALIAPHPELVKAVPFPVRRIPFVHGGVKVTLCLGKNAA